MEIQLTSNTIEVTKILQTTLRSEQNFNKTQKLEIYPFFIDFPGKYITLE